MKILYCLQDPVTNHIRYVGRTANLKQRYKNHCNPLHNKSSQKRHWIDELLKRGLKPILIELECVNDKDASFWERYYSDLFRSWNFDILNNKHFHLGNQTSFSTGGIPHNYGKNLTLLTKDKIRLSLKNNTNKPKQKVGQYNLNGTLIKVHTSLTEAAGMTKSSISKICLCCQNKRKSHNNYIWKYEN